MPALPLRPTIAAAAVVITLVTLAGGLVLYFYAQSAVQDVVDDSKASLDDMLQASIQALDQALVEAKTAIENSVDAGSNADIRLFGSLLRRTFTDVELGLQILVKETEKMGYLYTDVQQWARYLEESLCGMVKAYELSSDARMTGGGVAIYTGEAISATNNMASYCWWDPVPDGSKQWFMQEKTRYDANEGAWVYNLRYVDPVTTAYGAIKSTDLVSDGYEDPGEAYEAEWSSPETWLAESGQVALYMYYITAFSVPVPAGHFLEGAFVEVNTETDLAHWFPLVKAFVQDRNPEGAFFVAALDYGLGLIHTNESTPDMSKDQACVDGDSVSEGDLAELDSSACFPKLLNYSIVTQFVAETAKNGAANILHKATMCECGGVLVNCTAMANGTDCSTDTYYLRKLHLFTAGSFDFTVVWYRDTKELQGIIDQKQAESQAAINENRAKASAQAQQTEDKANEDLEIALIIMVLSVVCSFILSVILSLMWVVLLANPLKHLNISVQLMGEVKVDEAVEYYNDTNTGSLKVVEMQEIGKGFLAAAARLKEYRNYMPQSVLVDDDEEEEEVAESEKPVASKSSAKDQAKVSLKSVDSAGGARKSTDTVGGKSSAASRASRMSKAIKLTGGPAAEGVKKKQISLLITNVVGWHPTTLQMPGDAIVAAHSAIVNHMIQTITKAKGVPDTFSGDRMMTSFGAVRNLSTHRKAAAVTAAGLQKLNPGELKDPVTVSSAVVSGDALCGNIGCAGMKRFSFLSTLVTHGFALERVAKELGGLSVTDRVTGGEVKSDVVVCVVEFVLFTKRFQKPFEVLQIVEARKAGDDDEWMYQLEKM
eukprot:Hpha_TRINITY_DN16814_c5_g4::TRINITY_DN16814_c5_g4_i1::g.151598::m.151598